MTARGAWPFALLYQLHHALLGLLPDLAHQTVDATAVEVVCPSCNVYTVDMKYAQLAATNDTTLSCDTCATAFNVAGFASWRVGGPHAEHTAVVDAALVAAQCVGRQQASWEARVKHARGKLVEWSRQHVFSASFSSTMPVLWTGGR